MTYVLEAQRYIHGKGFEHVGYMEVLFRSPKKSCEYYDATMTPRMRSLNAHGTWRSDWDPDTCLRYVIRKYSGEVCTLKVMKATFYQAPM